MFSPTQFFIKQPKDTELVRKIRTIAGVPAEPYARVTRLELELKPSDIIHLDIGGEGWNKHESFISGFKDSINVNHTEYQSNGSGIRISNLVKIENWFKDPAYPFADGFADYITMQNAPLTPKNMTEIARCLRPGGKVELWIDDSFKENIEILAGKLKSKVEYEIDDEFNGSTGSKKVRIISQIKPKLVNDQTFSLAAYDNLVINSKMPKEAASPEVINSQATLSPEITCGKNV